MDAFFAKSAPIGRNAFLIRQGFLTLDDERPGFYLGLELGRNAFLIRQGFLTKVAETAKVSA